MSATWAAILLTAAGCYLLKLAGLSVPQRVLDHPVATRVATLLPVALLASLAGVQVFATGRELVVDARLAGVGVAVVAVALRAPFFVVVGSAAATAALTGAIAAAHHVRLVSKAYGVYVITCIRLLPR